MSADDELADSDTPDQTVHVADDLDEWLQRQRYRQIFEAKERAAEALRDAPGALGPGPNDAKVEANVRERVAAAVTQFVIEIERILKSVEDGSLWSSEQFDTFELREVTAIPDSFNDFEVLTGMAPARRQDGTIVYEINGVSDFVDLGETELFIEWEQVANPATGRIETNRVIRTPHPPVNVSRNVYREAAELLGDVGIDLDLEPESDEAGWGPNYRESDTDDE